LQEAIGALAAIAVLHTVITLVLGAVVAVLLLYPLYKDQPKRKKTSTQRTIDLHTQEATNSREATIPNVFVSSSVAHEQQSKSGDDSQDSPLPITTIEFEPTAQEPNVSAVRRRSRLSIGSFTSGVTWQFRKSMELNKEETIELINTTEERTPSSTESISQGQDESTAMSGDPELPSSSM